MADKDKKGKGKSFLVSNAMEALGEIAGRVGGNALVTWVAAMKPEVAAKFSGLSKGGLITQLIPHLLSAPIKGEVTQDSVKGLLSGALEAFSDLNIPDDPNLQKGYLTQRLSEAVKKYAGSQGTQPGKRSFADAFRGMDPPMRKLLKDALDTSNLWDAADWLSAGVDLSSKELEGFALMGDPAIRLIHRLLAASPVKPESITTRIERVATKMGHRALERAERLLDPDGSDWKGLTKDINEMADEDELRLRLLQRHR